MIAKFPGRCMFCKKPIVVGVDTYDVEIKKAFHETCKENQPPGPEAYTLADELGFVSHNDASIHAALENWRLRDHWLLRPLFNASCGDSAGRPGTEAPARRQSDLFGEEKGLA